MEELVNHRDGENEDGERVNRVQERGWGRGGGVARKGIKRMKISTDGYNKKEVYCAAQNISRLPLTHPISHALPLSRSQSASASAHMPPFPPTPSTSCSHPSHSSLPTHPTHPTSLTHPTHSASSSSPTLPPTHPTHSTNTLPPLPSTPSTPLEDPADRFRGIVYIDGLGDIVDVQAPLLKFQVTILLFTL